MAHRGGVAMPWKETSPMRERTEFIVEHRSGLYSFSALCEKYQISRKTGYKFLERFEVDGLEGLRDRSRARSEEHTSELQSLAYLVCRLLLEKKNAYIFLFRGADS